MRMYKMDLTVAVMEPQEGEWTVMVGTDGEMLGPLRVNTEALDDGTRAPKWADVARALRIWGAEAIAAHSSGDCIHTCPLCKGLMPKGMVE